MGIEWKQLVLRMDLVPEHSCTSGVKQCIKPALVIEACQVIETADMHLTHEDLRDGSTLGSLQHFC
jgi:hypothetical protein